MKRIKIDQRKCTGCRHCEVVCSLKHFSQVNPKKSRIRVFLDEEANRYYPVIAGPFTEAECTLKYDITIEGEEYDDCTLCRATCPSRPWFREPDTEVPLNCDFCGEPPDPECVKVCASSALRLEES